MTRSGNISWAGSDLFQGYGPVWEYGVGKDGALMEEPPVMLIAGQESGGVDWM